MGGLDCVRRQAVLAQQQPASKALFHRVNTIARGCLGDQHQLNYAESGRQAPENRSTIEEVQEPIGRQAESVSLDLYDCAMGAASEVPEKPDTDHAFTTGNAYFRTAPFTHHDHQRYQPAVWKYRVGNFTVLSQHGSPER